MDKTQAVESLANHIEQWFHDENNTCNESGSLSIGYVPDDVSKRLAHICIEALILNDAGQKYAENA